jgi:hypothetical protein
LEKRRTRPARHDAGGASGIRREFYALASVPGYTAAEISVAVEDCWLLISGYGHCSEQTELVAHDAEFDDRNATRQALERHAGDECDSRCNVEAADQSFQDGVVRRPFCVVELGSKVDATRSVAVLANVAGGADGEGGWRDRDSLRCEATLAESFTGCYSESRSRSEINPRQASYGWCLLPRDTSFGRTRYDFSP